MELRGKLFSNLTGKVFICKQSEEEFLSIYRILNHRDFVQVFSRACQGA